MDKSNKPTSSQLMNALSPIYEIYEDILSETRDYKKDWGYTKTSGWMLKIEKDQKALGYFIPFKGAFRFSMAIRDSEHVFFLESSNHPHYKDKLKNAKRFVEGYSVYFDINNEDDYLPFKAFILDLIVKRA
jgi:hypothetical protein